ncbi:general secretion pathway protein GspE [Hydrocoleum sp. CS-953]|uniref:GspE/PulE family protein n=1 Tax=Hydrocoleum sp. CS-953 TaxID=1671698 RepID=UPI000B9ADD7C|nr:GspE/PulE family protein [Hydrocoleum sp. CS-953]OZH54907.1 general secretion pathway protein GspE [Hydrocoleum sp. CS-953]
MAQSSSRNSRTAIVALSHLSPFGNKLVQAGYVNIEQFQKCQVESRKTGKSLTELLQALTGQALPPELLRHYKKQQLFELMILYGVAAFDPEITQIPAQQVCYLIDKVIPIEFCRNNQIIPLFSHETHLANQAVQTGSMSQDQMLKALAQSTSSQGKLLDDLEKFAGDSLPSNLVKDYESQQPFVMVAMVNPDNLQAKDELKDKILRHHGLNLQRLVITPEDYQHLINYYFDEQTRKDAAAAKEAEKKELELESGFFESSDLEDAADEAAVEDIGKSLSEAEDAPIIKAVNVILVKALSEGVSDIHVEPQEEFIQIRMRKDGVLQEYFRFPKKVIPAITSRFKILANLDIAERRQAQDGRIRKVFKGRTIDFRVNSLPSRYGEKIVLRILDSSSTQLGLDKLISDPETLALVRETASRPFGLILVTGPTGSGKSTSLYSILAERNDPGINISTAEDPIEYALPGITQCQVIREKDLTFASILRAFLRQDPDVLLVGETRDKETAKTAIEAALTGHLVLTTLHTNDAAGAIARLDEMGVESFMVSAALLGVLAQRLMRRVCTDCRVPYVPEPDELRRYGLVPSQEENVTFYKANTVSVEDRKVLAERGELCRKCGGLGYKGRVGVYEFMKITEQLQTLITQRAPTEQIKETAVEEGMVSLLPYSLNLVRQGHTTFEEVERVTFTDSGLEAEMKRQAKQNLICKSCNAELEAEWLDCPYCMTPRFE